MPEKQSNETTYFFATLNSRSKRGGRVIRITTKAGYQGMALARIGDIVTYDGGGEATILNGAGFAAGWKDKPPALVGYGLSNSDAITATLQDGLGSRICDGQRVPSQFAPPYTLPPKSATDGGNIHA